ncbi:IS200/IS605 family transposase [Brevibacillus brevis]|uniref:IS200/IS605 family transposase n=1 Tax=Brevibacillus brevis TaxID=1393 RepID=UPI0012DE3271|nr:IS200/IS605 family transposase [Brevibacillus brevis]
MSRSVESNHNVVFDCKYHVVFCPKYRKKVLKEPVDIRLKELFLEKAVELREVVEMEIMPDHVHLLIKCDPHFGIHRVVKHSLKSRLPSLWTNSCFVATVGTVQLDVIKNYMESQKERND